MGPVGSAMNCLYFINLPQEAVSGSFSLNLPVGSQVTLPAILAGFPYGGQYHFRVKVDAAPYAEGQGWKYVWMDVTSNEQVLPTLAPDLVVVKAVPLFELPDAAGDEFPMTPQEHMDWMTARSADEPAWSLEKYPIPALPKADSVKKSPSPTESGHDTPQGPSPTRSPVLPTTAIAASIPRVDSAQVKEMAYKVKDSIGTFTKRVIDSDAVKALRTDAVKGIKNVTSSFGKFFKALASNDLPPSDDVMANLQGLQLEMLTKFDSDLEEHEALLATVWRLLLPGHAYVRVSPLWQSIGFQQDNPVTDLRGSGMLALRCIVYFAEHYPDRVEDLIARQVANTDARALYPFGITAINVTCMLGDILGVRDTDLSPPKYPFWPLFGDGNAFYELFCLALTLLDRIWVRWSIPVDEFSAALQHVRKNVEALLDTAPATIPEMQERAVDMF